MNQNLPCGEDTDANEDLRGHSGDRPCDKHIAEDTRYGHGQEADHCLHRAKHLDLLIEECSVKGDRLRRELLDMPRYEHVALAGMQARDGHAKDSP